MREPSYDVDAVRKQAAEHFNGTDGFRNGDRKNAYECESCGSYIITVDREPGVTPFMVSCGNCKAMAKSKFYRVVDSLIPTHEWFRPETIDGLTQWSADHVGNGGLLLRKIGGGDSKEGWHEPASKEKLIEEWEGRLIALEHVEKIRAIERQQLEILRKMAEPSPIKREDYPSRQTFRAAQTAHRKGRA